MAQSDSLASDVFGIAQRIAGLRNACLAGGQGKTYLISLTVLDGGALLWAELGSGKTENQGGRS